MSLYNAVFGQNPFSGFLLNLIGVGGEDYPIPRFRDCWMDKDTGNIMVYTRTGGGNREAYAEENARLAEHPQYRTDYDDDFDSTYATFVFAVPDDVKDLAEAVKEFATSPGTVGERFQMLIDKLQSGDEDEETERAKAVGRRIAEEVQEHLSKGAPGEVKKIEV